MVEWPAWRFSPDGDDSQMFEKAEDVPEGWLSSPPTTIYEAVKQTPVICKETTIKKLEDYGVTIDPTWGAAKLQEVLKELSND